MLRIEIAQLKARLSMVANSSDRHSWDGSDHSIEEGHELYFELIGMHSFTLQLALMLSLVLGSLVHHAEISWLPESVIFVVVGIAMGSVILWSTHREFNTPDVDYWFAHVNEAMLNLIMLPPIIFESGWSLRLKDFLAEFRTIMIFAVFGTIISTMVIAYSIYWTSAFHGIESFRLAFTYASLISAVDPVATLATYSHLKVEPLLNVVVFGESIINDAVSIALFKAGDSLAPDVPLCLWTMTMQMAWLLLGSSVLGVLVAYVLSKMIRWSHMSHNPVFAAATVVMTSWFTFILAEGIVHCSGIIASLVCGATLGAVLRPHLEATTDEKVSFVLKQVATLCDIAIFLLVGMAAVLLDQINLGFCIFIAVLCLIGRFLAVFPLGGLVNILKRCHGSRNNLPRASWNELSLNHLFMMWCAGLRGGIAMALVLQMKGIDADENAKQFRQATFFVIMAFLLTFGSTTPCLLAKVGISFGEDAPEDALAKSNDLNLGRTLSRSVLRRTISFVDAQWDGNSQSFRRSFVAETDDSTISPSGQHPAELGRAPFLTAHSQTTLVEDRGGPPSQRFSGTSAHESAASFSELATFKRFDQVGQAPLNHSIGDRY